MALPSHLTKKCIAAYSLLCLINSMAYLALEIGHWSAFIFLSFHNEGMEYPHGCLATLHDMQSPYSHSPCYWIQSIRLCVIGCYSRCVTEQFKAYKPCIGKCKTFGSQSLDVTGSHKWERAFGSAVLIVITFLWPLYNSTNSLFVGDDTLLISLKKN
jgi:hypothetical protein